MRDFEADNRTFLLANSALRLLVDQRVYAKINPPTNYRPEIDGACIVFGVRGGGFNSQNDCLFSPSVQYRCYAESEASAREVYFALVDALNDAAYSGIHARLETLGQLARETDTGWPFVFCSFSHTVVNS